LNVKGTDYKVRLTEASSGFQSLVPLYIVSNYLANSVRASSQIDKEPMSSEELSRFKKGVQEIWSNDDLTEEQKRAALSVLSAKFNKTAFINIVEEPEQNLFPSSQWKILQSLLELNNINNGNKLILTTHSPYIINYLTIAVQGEELRNKILNSNKVSQLISKLNTIIPEKSLVAARNLIVYQLDEINGTIKTLSSPYGIPSDQNFLNQMLNEGNELFDALLEIEQEL
jgi:hypothetical protein